MLSEGMKVNLKQNCGKPTLIKKALIYAASKCFSHEVTPFESLLKHVIITTMLPNCTWRSVSILYNQRFIWNLTRTAKIWLLDQRNSIGCIIKNLRKTSQEFVQRDRSEYRKPLSRLTFTCSKSTIRDTRKRCQ